MLRVYIESNGCAVLRHETQRYAKFFRQNGWTEVDKPEIADLVLMTTCGVVGWTEAKALEAIQRLCQTVKPPARLVIGGCLTKIDPEMILKIAPNVMMFGPQEEDRLDQLIGARVSIKDITYTIGAVREHSMGDPMIAYSTDEIQQLKIAEYLAHQLKQPSFLEVYDYLTRGRHLWKEDGLFEVKVASGCAHHCSYCATKIAIGEMRSQDMEVVLTQIREGVALGYSKIVLMGDEVGYYGVDIGTNLTELLHQIEKIPGNFRIAFRYIYPDVLVKLYRESDLKRFFESGRIYFFCSAFQSGSPDILRRMHRNPNIEQFADVIRDIALVAPNAYRHTQIIVGFPGETEADLAKTIQTLDACQWDYITTTAYADRPGTKAMLLEGHLSESEIQRRFQTTVDYTFANRNRRIWQRFQQQIIRNLIND